MAAACPLPVLQKNEAKYLGKHDSAVNQDVPAPFSVVNNESKQTERRTTLFDPSANIEGAGLMSWGRGFIPRLNCDWFTVHLSSRQGFLPP